MTTKKQPPAKTAAEAPAGRPAQSLSGRRFLQPDARLHRARRRLLERAEIHRRPRRRPRPAPMRVKRHRCKCCVWSSKRACRCTRCSRASCKAPNRACGNRGWRRSAWNCRASITPRANRATPGWALDLSLGSKATSAFSNAGIPNWRSLAAEDCAQVQIHKPTEKTPAKAYAVFHLMRLTNKRRHLLFP